MKMFTKSIILNVKSRILAPWSSPIELETSRIKILAWRVFLSVTAHLKQQVLRDASCYCCRNVIYMIYESIQYSWKISEQKSSQSDLPICLHNNNAIKSILASWRMTSNNHFQTSNVLSVTAKYAILSPRKSSGVMRDHSIGRELSWFGYNIPLQ